MLIFKFCLSTSKTLRNERSNLKTKHWFFGIRCFEFKILGKITTYTGITENYSYIDKWASPIITPNICLIWHFIQNKIMQFISTHFCPCRYIYNSFWKIFETSWLNIFLPSDIVFSKFAVNFYPFGKHLIISFVDFYSYLLIEF